MGYRCSFLPQGLTAWIHGRIHWEGSYYTLYRDSQIIVIQGPPAGTKDQITCTEGFTEVDRKFDFGAEVIQTLLPVIDFGRSNWAYLVRDPDGSYRLVYRDEPILRRMTVTTWAPMVEERDIDITKWGAGGEAIGMWNGREVDLQMSWNDDTMLVVEKSTRAHRLLLGLDLTYGLIAHVVRDGELSGVMMEPAYGRQVEYSDRPLLYEAFSRMEEHGLIFPAIFEDMNVMIHSGKVRFTPFNLHVVARSRDPKDHQEQWRKLDRMLQAVRDGNRSHYPPRSASQITKILSSTPSPTSPLSLFDQSFHMISFLTVVYKSQKRKEDKSSKVRHRQISRRQQAQGRLLAPPRDDEHHARGSDDPLHETPLTPDKFCSIRLYARALAHPYPRNVTSAKLLLGTDDS